jgi:hypothetical protein
MTGRPAAAPAAGPSHGLRTAVVLNPTKVAHPEAVLAELTRSLVAHGWPAPAWAETTRDDPGGGQTAASVRARADVVFAAGGDGTVRACAEQLAGTATALAVLPLGTGYLLARNLGVPTAIPDAVAPGDPIPRSDRTRQSALGHALEARPERLRDHLRRPYRSQRPQLTQWPVTPFSGHSPPPRDQRRGRTCVSLRGAQQLGEPAGWTPGRSGWRAGTAGHLLAGAVGHRTVRR